MDSFGGFTDEDIQRLSDNPENANGKEREKLPASKNMQRHKNRLTQKNFTRERILKKHVYSNQNSPSTDIPEEARLSIPQIPEEEETTAKENSNTKIKERNVESPVEPLNNVQSKTTRFSVETKTEKQVEALKTDQHGSTGTSSEKVIPFLLCAEANDKALEEFESRQRKMEEQNKQRKEILKKAIADRARRTHEETKRLNEIEGELKKLDLLLSNDVAILRNQIESASLEFSEAQKRYDKAEKEFLDAKLDMFNKKERKELLTSHLCTIIEQNEMRKAKRLSDLMMKLEMGCNSIVHFEISQWELQRKDGWKKPNAIPTIFNVPNPPKKLATTRQSLYKAPQKDDIVQTDGTDTKVQELQNEVGLVTLKETTQSLNKAPEKGNIGQTDGTEARVHELQNEVAALKEQLIQKQSLLRSFFNEEQISSLVKTPSKWSSETIVLGLKLRFSLGIHGTTTI